MIEVVTVETTQLGNRSYLVHDESVAVVIDPQRDIDRILAVVSRLGITVTHVVETHVHNDYVSGGLQLARTCGAAYALAGDEPVAFADERVGVHDGDVLQTGALLLQALHTPGHTPHHLAWMVRDSRGGAATAVFTGGSMLFGGSGRTDLLGSGSARELSRAQWSSVRRLGGLGDSVSVHPTHGFGSFCSAGATSQLSSSTIGRERRENPAFSTDQDAYVDRLLAGLADHPPYYAHMAVRNRSQAVPLDLRPPPETGPDELKRRLEAGEWVVDLRPRREFAAGHLPGSVSVEYSRQFATNLGCVIPWGIPVTLLAEDRTQVALAQRDLCRIGIDRPAGAATVDVLADVGPLGSYAVAGFGDMARAWAADDRLLVVDVRRGDEWRSGRAVGARHVPLEQVATAARHLPLGRQVWVHCAAGLRASTAASLLARAGVPVVLVDDRWGEAEVAGIPVAVGGAADADAGLTLRRT